MWLYVARGFSLSSLSQQKLRHQAEAFNSWRPKLSAMQTLANYMILPLVCVAVAVAVCGCGKPDPCTIPCFTLDMAGKGQIAWRVEDLKLPRDQTWNLHVKWADFQIDDPFLTPSLSLEDQNPCESGDWAGGWWCYFYDYKYLVISQEGGRESAGVAELCDVWVDYEEVTAEPVWGSRVPCSPSPAPASFRPSPSPPPSSPPNVNNATQCPEHQYRHPFTGKCTDCPGGKEPSQDQTTCEEETALGVSMSAWEVIGVAASVLSFIASLGLCAWCCRRTSTSRRWASVLPG